MLRSEIATENHCFYFYIDLILVLGNLLCGIQDNAGTGYLQGRQHLCAIARGFFFFLGMALGNVAGIIDEERTINNVLL